MPHSFIHSFIHLMLTWPSNGIGSI